MKRLGFNLSSIDAALGCFLVFILISKSALAAAKRPPSPSDPLDGKRMIEVRHVQKVQIELPNHTLHSFGEDYQSQLMTRLTRSDRFLVSVPESVSNSTSSVSQFTAPAGHYSWQGSVTPAAVVDVEVRALTFRTGGRGDRIFYGFDENFRTPFNRGTSLKLNEFPMKDQSDETSWFGASFDDQGHEPFNRRAGLDLGDGINLNFLFAWLTLKYAEYHAELRLRLYLTLASGKTEFHDVSVQGKGFYFDAVGSYSGYSAGIMAARNDAFLQTVSRAMDASFGTLESVLRSTPLVARVDAVASDGTVLLGTGQNSQVRSGVLYSLMDNPQVALRVVSSGMSGSEAQVVSGDSSLIRAGAMVQQVQSIPSSAIRETNLAVAAESTATSLSVPASVSSIQLPDQNLAKPSLPKLNHSVNWHAVWTETEAWLKSLTGVIFLPYRVYRYFAYDQKYHRNPDLSLAVPLKNSETWKSQIGLSQAPPMRQGEPVVAIIDSGVDYNHPLLHSSLWLNPTPWNFERIDLDRYGWNFISNDSHPYDDHAHGTQLASLIVGVAPRAKIMPLKIFNPWGMTTSASIYAAFQYAVDHGAQVILCGWSTSVNSEALKSGVGYANKNGVSVVVSAGDGGWNLSHVWAYPSAYASEMDHVVVATAVDSQDRIVSRGSRSANFSQSDVMIAAPGQDLEVAEPRGARSVATSSDLAAALVAGGLARVIAAQSVETTSQGEPGSAIQTLLADADHIPALVNQVRGGLRLRIRR